MVIGKSGSSCPLPDDNAANGVGSQELLTISKENSQSRRLHELERQVQLSKLVTQINNRLSSTLDLDEVLNSACRLLALALNCSRVSLLVQDPEDKSVLITRGEYNQSDYPSQLGLRVPLDDNPHLRLLMSQSQPVAVKRFRDFPGLGDRSQKVANDLSIRSMLAIATRYQGQVNGIIGAHQCDREREWTQWEQQLFEAVAPQLGIAIDRAQLHHATRLAAERESLLRLVTNQIRSTLDLDTIRQTAVRGVRQLLETDRVVIYQFVEGWHGIVMVEDVVEPWDSVLGDLGADDCFSGKYAHLYEEGRIRAIDDIHEAGLNECHVKFLEKLQVRANLIVPIIIRDRLWGLLIAHECRGTRKWKTSEAQLLRQLGDQLGIALQQAELYATVQTTAQESQARAQQLQETLEELQATQLQLIQSEKLSSLGRMVAGVAHEINNANNFIHANLPHARDCSEILFEAVDRCGTSDRAEIEEEFDLDYLREDLPKILQSMRVGSDRIRSIVQKLRNFSHHDEAETKAVNLNEGIDSSLAMLQHRLEDKIEIRKDYGDLPKVECRPQQLNQVFFNLLQNAIDAIEQNGETGEITIRTWQTQPEWVSIAVRDNGAGIAPDAQQRVFDPFFTTKSPGKGTGLGLSLCYQIVQGHGGSIHCNSEPGNGTEFVVEIPIQAKSKSP